MYLVAPDILADACGLSLGLILLVIPIGLVLWIMGWRSHRFWVVLFATVLGGVYGLQATPNPQAPQLTAAVLLALAAGLLALALARLAAFAGGGLAGLLAVQATYPTLNQPLLAFLVSGLVCLLLFRPCMMALTSLAGALLLSYATLMLLHYYALLDAPVWSAQSGTLLNSITGALAAVGMLGQFLLDRYVFRPPSASKGWRIELRKLLSSRSGESSRSTSARRAA